MKFSRKLALAVLPIAAILAGCASSASKDVATETAAQQEQTQQAASFEVYAASDKVVKGYRPLKVSEQTTIYVAQQPLFTRDQLTNIESVQDDKGRIFVRAILNPTASKALAAVKNRGFVTVVGSQVVSLNSARDGENFLFLVGDQQTAQTIVTAVKGQPVQPPLK
ncbi:hypothetical protein F9B74_01215 [Pelistega sp. NLN82]|uniref:Preprotein translocase subunit SecD n=1 Tax=Pelistega ratti TaxID=2652177 RepID=A0A6L9Y3G8_9BURK|nr:hypothetical protein [Pelistega ratti]NEN74950.1 hypothetical protein [Pelistega ratti]